MKWAVLILGILANTLASILIKKAVARFQTVSFWQDPLGAIYNWPLWAGLVFFGLGFLFYAASLVKMPLHVAQPILASGVISLAVISSVLLFEESLSVATASGIVLVLAGIVLITSGS